MLRWKELSREAKRIVAVVVCVTTALCVRGIYALLADGWGVAAVMLFAYVPAGWMVISWEVHLATERELADQETKVRNEERQRSTSRG